MKGTALVENGGTRPYPLVSIVIPCWNDGKYIDETIASVDAQTYGNIELIIVDDGSDDDETKRILQRLKEEGRKVIAQENNGPGAARNTGIRASKGVYILPLDSDDCIGPTYVEKAVCEIEKNDDLGIVYCLADKFGEESGLWELPEFSMPEMLFSNCIFVSALFRKCDWEQAGGYDENLKTGWEDWDFWLSLIGLGREVYRIPEMLFHYRRKPSSQSTIKRLIGNEESWHDIRKKIFNNHRQLYADYLEKLVELSEDCNFYKQKCANIQSSVSWRITAPLRKAGALLGRINVRKR